MYLQADKKAIKKELLDIIENSRRKVTPGELEKALSRKYSLERKEIRSLIRGLVTENFLAYTSHYGRTFIEKSFNKAVRISKHVILKPPGVNYKYREDDVVIEICQGVSFGDGQHPTTRLAIKGIEYALNKTDLLKGKDKTSVLDIGTGSGVLGITALLLGIKNAVG
ncbi:MAG: 50S ribosomal protein L11 methyltransferase, partial [Proteobacteria bacterium]|nr:50S ribosomal protein L11 methyltransferase [Pseudomonadota bacterium]